MGKLCHTQANGQTITVRVIELEQRLGPKRGKWVCRREEEGQPEWPKPRKMWRTTRQLRPLD